MKVVAPRVAGFYRLELTVVQEHVAWLEAVQPGLARGLDVVVEDGESAGESAEMERRSTGP
ncbi:hypothetical protein HS125_09950 [bacterium]|nr:hypothetical protein [bacterium]